MKPKIIEKRNVERDYGFIGTEVIIDHPKHGRLMIMDAFGWREQNSGGKVRWRHGMAIQLKDGDTFASLAAENSDPHYLRKGYDAERPVLDWDGFIVSQIASGLGL